MAKQPKPPTHTALPILLPNLEAPFLPHDGWGESGWREALKGLGLLPVGLLVLPDDPLRFSPPPGQRCPGSSGDFEELCFVCKCCRSACAWSGGPPRLPFVPQPNLEHPELCRKLTGPEGVLLFATRHLGPEAGLMGCRSVPAGLSRPLQRRG